MKRWMPELLLILTLVALAVASASVGTTKLTAWDMVSNDSAIHALARTVVVDIRLPRTVLAILAGAALGLSGAVLQGLLRNPLADPGVVGQELKLGVATALVGAPFFLWQVLRMRGTS